MIPDKTLQTLELDKILERVRDQASFSAGQEAVTALRPAADVDGARALLAQTTEARALLEARPSTHLGGAHDVRAAVRRAEIGSILTARDLLDIATTLTASGRVRLAAIAVDFEIPWLRSRVERMIDGRDLRESIDSTFNDRGDVLDSASPELRRLRSDIKTAQARLVERLNSMVTSPDNRTVVQEPIVTMRNGRYVIPVRHDSRSRIPGVVHDQSSSGQTVFIEPLVVTEMNNRLTELQLAEEREVDRILEALSRRVASQADALRSTVVALAEVDVAFARAKYADSIGAAEPRLNGEGRVSLVSARHPLLTGEVVPTTVWLGEDFRILLITGPNTGGKTVALKTVGLLTLMAQSGMHIPAAPESDVAVFPTIFADIGDEQSIEQSLSTFSSHMRNIIAMIPRIDAESLVLLDELGAGTDPSEGSALARSIVTELLQRGARGVITTHFSELKSFAHEQEGVENASVEFDVQTLSPTYRLVIGVPGRSQALAIARRLGMPQHVLRRARESISTGAMRVENMLSQIQSERAEISRLYARARAAHEDAKKLRDRVQSELDLVQRERGEILEAARNEASSIVRDMRRDLRAIEDEARGMASRREQRDVRARLDDVQRTTAERLGAPERPDTDSGARLRPVEPGATVRVLSLDQQGSVLSVSNGEAEVQLGLFKMRVPVDDLEVLGRREREPERAVQFTAAREAPPMEIDVRGWRADDAVREIDQYLHDNYMHGQGTVRIVHGKGTGALRKAIRQQLDENPLVKGFGTEKPELGGEGVTVVTLKV